MYSDGIPVETIAAQTLSNVRHQYERLSRDEAVKTVFNFLLVFSRSCRSDDPVSELRDAGISLPDKPSPLSVVKELRQQMPTDEAASEYGQLALAAGADAIGQWHKDNPVVQPSLFKARSDFLESWGDLGSGSGFCELSRLFFGKLTERYLNYFLDRAASETLPSIHDRNRFEQDIKSHVDDVSKHAFETAKIGQSFAAGWFNRHARDRLPTEREVESFLAVQFGKLRDELRREGERK
ncbi:MAG TPA: hypothetical protein PLG59_11020 [bacterium]|nr:hypothetical protein [bacterium]HQO35186.1 hypothetical protein [bacterium]HQP97173.1 hypothetical protein [bacterium]